jgi:predicted porin
MAIEFTATPELSMGTRSTDNVLFSSENRQSALGFDAGGSLSFIGQSDTYRTTFTPSLNLRRFAVGDNLDADEYGVRSDHRWNVSDALNATLKADYYQDSTLSTELTDVGRQNDVTDRDTLSLQPGVIYQLDAANAVNMGFAYTDVTTDPKAGLIDYTYSQASAGGTHSLSEAMQTFVSGFVSWFDVPSLRSATTTYGFQTGVTWQCDEVTRVEASVGYLTSDINFIDQYLAIVSDPVPRIVLVQEARTTSTSGPIAGFSLTRNFENLKARFDFSRQVSPTLRGQQSLEDSLRIGADYDFSRELTAGISGQYNIRSAQSEQVGFAAADLNTDQFTTSGYVGFRYSEHVTIRAEYRYSHQELNTLTAASDSNGVFLNLNYSGDPFSFGVW